MFNIGMSPDFYIVDMHVYSKGGGLGAGV